MDRTRNDAWGYSTKAIHGYQGRDPQTGAISYPLYQSATFAHPALGESTGFAYSRCGNPTVLELENTIAQLEGGLKALAFSSGTAAISTLLKLFGSGDCILACDDIYGGTYRLFHDVYQDRYGMEFDFVDFTDLDAVRAALAAHPNTRAFFVETPTNPMMHVFDIRALADLAHQHNAILVVDNTFLTSYFQRPFDLGADVVVYSGTKYLCGHNDVICGFTVLKDETLLQRHFTDYMSEGSALPPFEAWLMLRSLKTLSVRMDRQEQNACRICEFLKQHPHVADVYYVGDPDHPDYELSTRQCSGFGAMISFRVDTHQRLLDVLERVKIIAFAESLGGTESLITFPQVQTHGSIPDEMTDALGIDDRLLRLSVGLEDVDDLISDLSAALA
ncbi:MAG: PLP-dependent aspartate aminotransferase family protein [Coriobacteriia bacterium]|nr:PLP-dependent aspartate aminotransferase family protein [Coriobacteriia bacterium]